MHTPCDLARAIAFVAGRRTVIAIHNDPHRGLALLAPDFGYGIPFALLRRALGKFGTCNEVGRHRAFGAMAVDFSFDCYDYRFTSDDSGGGVIVSLRDLQDVRVVHAALLRDRRFVDASVAVSE